MYKVLTLNNISPIGLKHLPSEKYTVSVDLQNPDAILLRSFNMHDYDISSSVKAVGRAGSGVNNIPIDVLSQRGIPVFNAPGANANAVKELVITGMLLACRNICPAWDYVCKLEGDDAAISKQVEAGKKKFAGYELPGKTLGIVGLGAIGSSVAKAALGLDMQVIGFDPGLTVESAWQLSSNVEQARSVEELIARVDFISFHVPLTDATKNLINAQRIELMKDGIVILNFARKGIVDDNAVIKAIKDGKISAYVCDFPSNLLINQERVIALPHLGASTKEAEDNCAVMVAKQVREYLEHGNIVNSVNFPEVVMQPAEGFRISIVNANVPNMVGQISTAMANADLNIIDMINKSRGELAYTLIDVNRDVPTRVIEEIQSIEGITAVRTL